MSLFFKERLPIGIDISDYKIRLVQLGKSGSKIKLLSFNEIQILNGAITDGLFIDENIIIQSLINLKKNVFGSRLFTNKAIIGVPEKQTFLKLIPYASESAIDIQKEICKHIPYELNEIYYNYKFLSDFYNNSSGVQFALAKKEYIDQLLKILSKAGWEPQVLEIETEAIARCLLLKDYDSRSAYIIADIGLARTTIFIVYKNKVIFSISFNTIIKKSEVYLSDFLQALKKVIIFYQQFLSEETKISAILTCGSGAHTHELNEKTEKIFGLRTLAGNVWQNISKPSDNFIKKMNYPLGYTTALGLVLRAAHNKKYI